MKEGYVIRSQEAPHFMTFTVLDWVDVFTRKVYRDILWASFKFCQEQLGGRIRWGGYYIIAPENGCGGSVNPDHWQQVWQYGSNLGEKNADFLWKQDGVAPQCAVGGLEIATVKSGRAFIPDSYTTTRPVLKTRIIRID